MEQSIKIWDLESKIIVEDLTEGLISAIAVSATIKNFTLVARARNNNKDFNIMSPKSIFDHVKFFKPERVKPNKTKEAFMENN
ncbi:hypothetical protein CMV_008148 [Castanea mollissima]|uniref:Uncharacterized protein n=1 Tax=Castanea mollissima TaxID=60419 RepID=A0A8J4RM80_9ROSI|nr:hypothetical protein CMV_008148 [Castanea mollissima]